MQDDKDDKVGKKTANKEERKRKKKSEGERSKKIRKKVEILACAHA